MVMLSQCRAGWLVLVIAMMLVDKNYFLTTLDCLHTVKIKEKKIALFCLDVLAYCILLYKMILLLYF